MPDRPINPLYPPEHDASPRPAVGLAVCLVSGALLLLALGIGVLYVIGRWSPFFTL